MWTMSFGPAMRHPGTGFSQANDLKPRLRPDCNPRGGQREQSELTYRGGPGNLTTDICIRAQAFERMGVVSILRAWPPWEAYALVADFHIALR